MDIIDSGVSVFCWVSGISTVCVVFCFLAFCVVNGKDEHPHCVTGINASYHQRHRVVFYYVVMVIIPNNMLNKISDDDKDRDEDLEDQTNQDDNDELFSVEENINRKLEKVLELFKLFQ
ncbi:15975_t:CDS:2 [Funneliformis geosporum]|nr:15975_t:CDS:2 [Funneliformis geosporum]